MLTFAHPWIFLLLPLALLVRFVLSAYREQLEHVYQELDQLEPLDYESTSFRPKDELYFWPVITMLVLMIGYHWGMGIRTVLSRHGRAGVEELKS